MDFASTLTVVWFAIKPNLVFIVLLLLALTFSIVAGRKHWRKPAGKMLWLVSLLCALGVMLIAPAATHSSISYIFTWVDKLSLLAVGVAAFIYSWLLLRPWLTTGSHLAKN